MVMRRPWGNMLVGDAVAAPTRAARLLTAISTAVSGWARCLEAPALRFDSERYLGDAADDHQAGADRHRQEHIRGLAGRNQPSVELRSDDRADSCTDA